MAERRRKPRLQVSTAADASGPAVFPGHSSEAAESATNDDIAHLAYELYEQRGSLYGHDWDDWFQAERELRKS